MAAAMQALRAGFARRARDWIIRRQGYDEHHVALHHRRIYILPTRSGLAFAVILFVMLLGSMNYSNNMGFALTFLLAGTAILSIHWCHRSLAGISIGFLDAHPVFAGRKACFRLRVVNPGALPRLQIEMGWRGSEPQVFDLPAEGSRAVSLELPAPGRGVLPMPQVIVATRFPLGLFRCWASINMNAAALVYPAPAGQAPAPPREPDTRGAGQQRAAGQDDFAGFRAYQHGDPPRQVAWKMFARSGEMLVSQYHGGARAERWIDFASAGEGDFEQKLSTLCRQLLTTAAQGDSFGLRVPGHEIAPGDGDAHLHACLACLARLPAPGGDA